MTDRKPQHTPEEIADATTWMHSRCPHPAGPAGRMSCSRCHAALLAERDALRLELNRFQCESCGADDVGPEGDNRCRGCDLVICQACCDVFEHFGDGQHGTGNPQEECRKLRARVAERDALREQVKERDRELRMWRQGVEQELPSGRSLRELLDHVIDAYRVGDIDPGGSEDDLVALRTALAASPQEEKP